MGCRFEDYSRPSDAVPEGITTDEGDSSDEDTSRPRTATPNEEPGADEPMETDDGAETTLRHTPTPEVPELFTAEDVTRWTVAPPDWVTNTDDRTLPTPLVQEILRRLEPQWRGRKGGNPTLQRLSQRPIKNPATKLQHLAQRKLNACIIYYTNTPPPHIATD
ncbi:GL19983 [Drosophila persimilis]|uniref:GL19983 n=1 Tax=Drosophila persimilis TaxID=7234 RepID=B4IRP7_DROPE|nr:GL19983 [Drosophila persimilis]